MMKNMKRNIEHIMWVYQIMKNNVNVVSNAKDVSSKVQENDSTVNFKRVASRSNMFNFIND